jgi:UDP-N-acetylglucosamine kinase
MTQSPDDLGEEPTRRIFTEQIVPDLLTGQPQHEPVVVIIAGPPGAGKSRAQDAIVTRLGRQQGVVIDADDLRSYHPRYEAHALADDLAASARTQPTASRWVNMAVDHAIAHRYDIVYSTTLGNPAQCANRLKHFRAERCRVVVAIVGVHEAQSRLGVLHRYQDGRDRYGHGRFVPAAYQQRAYEGLLGAVDRIDNEHLADEVYVLRRDGHVTYHNVLEEGQWREPPGARRAVEEARNRPWTAAETIDFREAVAALDGRLRAELRGELAAVLKDAATHIRASLGAASHEGAENRGDITDRDRERLPRSLGEAGSQPIELTAHRVQRGDPGSHQGQGTRMGERQGSRQLDQAAATRRAKASHRPPVRAFDAEAAHGDVQVRPGAADLAGEGFPRSAMTEVEGACQARAAGPSTQGAAATPPHPRPAPGR